MNIDHMKLRELKEIANLFNQNSCDMQPFKMGENYLIRTVTHIDVGKITAVGEKEIVITNTSWIADTGRFHDALATGKLTEVEPYPADQDVIIGRGSLIDATKWNFDLPQDQK